MNSRVRFAAKHLTLLQEEFTPAELDEAIEILMKNGKKPGKLSLIIGEKPSKNQKSRRRGQKTKSSKNQLSRAVIKLKKSEPEKYQLLSNFETLVRSENIPLTLDDIRRQGEKIDKQFSAGKSKKEAIGRFMAVLSDLPVTEIELLLKSIREREPEDDSGYKRLADFIITGGNRLRSE